MCAIDSSNTESEPIQNPNEQVNNPKSFSLILELAIFLFGVVAITVGLLRHLRH